MNNIKNETIIMKEELGLVKLVKYENQEKLAEMEKNDNLPADAVIKNEKDIYDKPIKIYYKLVNLDITKEEISEYFEVQNILTQKKISEDVGHCRKYLKFFVTLTVISLVIALIGTIVALVVANA